MVVNGSKLRLSRWLLLGCLIASLGVFMPVVAQEAGTEAFSVGVQLVAEGLSAPVAMATPNDGSGRLFVADQAGMIRIIGSDGTLMPDPFLDLTSLIVPLREDYDERGVLGLAFHPDYANNGRFFVYFTAPLRPEGPGGWDHTNVVAEFNVSADNPDVADLASQKNVLQIDHPQFNHDSGHITFGPDGYLYIPIGDGGGANDNEEGHTPGLGNGQDLSNLHGSILRIDLNGEPGTYAIPADNPFAAVDGTAPEIYAYGFRNPFDISFDVNGDGSLFAADAGQDLYEEVSIVTAGGNYGWNIKEGTHCFDPNNPETPPAECATTGADGEPLVDPIIEYSHDDVGIVVVGGHVYRGSAMPDLAGYYIFGDYSKTGDGAPDGTLLWAQPSAEGGMWTWGELSVAGTENNRVGAFVLGIGEDESGELYAMTSTSSAPMGDTGKIWKLIPAAEATGDTGATEMEATPATSSDTGAGAGTEPTAPPAEGSEPVTSPEPSG